MATIANEVYLLCIKWDNQYNNVVNFGSNSNFGNYAISNSKYKFLNSTEIRNNSIMIALNKYILEDKNINYICYRNTNYTTKYFGAFITSIEYINDGVALVTFEIDIWNSYFYGSTLNQCYVEREHINKSDDYIGTNTIAEPVQIGNKQLYENTSSKIDYGKYMAVLFTNFVVRDGQVQSSEVVTSIIKGNISSYSTSYYDISTEDGIALLNSTLTNISKAGKSDGILALYYCPQKCYTAVRETLQLTTKGGYIYDEYTPRNKKLYTSQFCSCIVDNARGNSQEYFFEKMSRQEDGSVLSYAYFDFFLVPTPAVHYYLSGYENITNNYMRSGVFMNFQQGSYNIDTFSKYVGDNANGLIFGALSQTLAVASNPNNIVGNISAVGGNISNMLDIANKPPIFAGTQGSTQFDNYINNNYAKSYALALDVESAKRVDDFLSIYGYQTNIVKVPNISNRSIWNYVKTRDCSLSNCPSNYNRALSDIFNKGVFIWHNAQNVGKFDVKNN